MPTGGRALGTDGVVGAWLGIAAGLACFAYGLVGLFDPETALPLAIAFLGAGFLDGVLCFFALRRSRPAWSFAVSLNGTGFLITLFRAIQLGGEFTGVDASAIALCLVFLLATIFLAMASRDYELE
jgi:hypothetical protein